MIATSSSIRVAPVRVAAARVQTTASLKQVGKAAANFALVGAASLSLAFGANAAAVKLGGDGGELQFVPSSVTIAKGESVTWTNNKGFPHNVVFDEDAIPSGVSADSLSHEDYLNGPGDSVSTKFDVAGEYSYYCEPHQGAGMQGKVIVQ